MMECTNSFSYIKPFVSSKNIKLNYTLCSALKYINKLNYMLSGTLKPFKYLLNSFIIHLGVLVKHKRKELLC
jgi:hypothetical protein